MTFSHAVPVGPSEHLLIVGDEGDVPVIRRLLRLLPDAAYGQVVIETLAEEDREALPAPDGVAVTWLARSTRPSRVPCLAFADRGEALVRAIVGWAVEWLALGDARHADRHVVWVGAGDSGAVDAACDLLLRPLCDRVRTLGEVVDDLHRAGICAE